MTFTLGATPAKMVVKLSPDADFVATIKNTDGAWPSGVSIDILFDDGTVWPATISGDEARWDKDKAEVNTLIADTAAIGRRVRLFYVDGAYDALWASGLVSVNA